MSTESIAHQVVPGAAGAESAAATLGAVRPRDSLFHWCGTAESVGRATRPEHRRDFLAAYFGEVAEVTIAAAARLFAGQIFPPGGERAPAIGGDTLLASMAALTHCSVADLRAHLAKAGDLGTVAAEVFAGRLPSGVSVSEVEAWAGELAAVTDARSEQALVSDMLARLSSLEAQYLVWLVCGQPRLAVGEEEIVGALAAAFGYPVDSVRRARESVGEIGEAARLARRRELAPSQASP